MGCLYPQGVIKSDKNLLFNHESITQVFAIGYTSDEQKKFMRYLNRAMELREERLKRESKKDIDSSN